MSFAIVDHDGTDFAVLLLEPNRRDNGSLDIVYSFGTTITVGDSGRETREPDQPDLRLRQSCAYTLTKAESHTLRTRLAALSTTPIAVPLWIDQLTGANWGNRLHDCELIARLSDGAILASDAELSDTETYVPLLIGRLIEKQPEASPLAEESGSETDFTIVEDSEWGYRLTIKGAAVAGTWPTSLVPETTSNLKDFSETGLVFEKIGRRRKHTIEHQETAFKWGQSASFVLGSRAEIALFLQTFEAHAGRLRSFSMPWWFRPGADAPTTPHETIVRFGSDQIRVEYVTAVTARITLTFWQLPWEITPIEGETPVQPGRFFLYRHTLQTPTTPIIWRYTDYPAPITVEEDAEDVTYFPADIEHDKITQGYQLDDDPVTLKSFVADSHPWMLALKRMLEAPLQLDIFEVDPENPVPVLKHTGELDAPTGKGRKLAMKSTALSGALDIKVPNFYVQESCNHEWCSIGCGKDIEDYTFTATIDVIDGREITVTITVNPPASAMGADYFANGDCSIGAGSTFEGREIIRSENLGSGQQKLTIDHALRAPSIDQEVSIRPACQGTWAECSAFANTINYGGHRHVGADNISVPARETNAQGGKK